MLDVVRAVPASLEVDVAGARIRIVREAFDSDVLGVQIGRIRDVDPGPDADVEVALREAASEARSAGFDQLLRSVPADRIGEAPPLGRAGFELIDLQVVFTHRFREPRTAPDDARIRAAVERDLEHLDRDLSSQPWRSRFERDPAYAPERVRELKRRWLRNSLNGRADLFVVADAAGEPTGYLTGLLESDRRGRIELVGTVPSHRRQGVAGRLVAYALAWFSARTDEVTVRAQADNRGSIRLYTRAGFGFDMTELIFRMNLPHAGAEPT